MDEKYWVSMMTAPPGVPLRNHKKPSESYCIVLAIRTYGGVISLIHCKWCLWLHMYNSTMWSWIAMVRTNGHGDFESQRIIHIRVTSNVVVAQCSNSFIQQPWGCTWDQVQNLLRPNSFKRKREKKKTNYSKTAETDK